MSRIIVSLDDQSKSSVLEMKLMVASGGKMPIPVVRAVTGRSPQQVQAGLSAAEVGGCASKRNVVLVLSV